MAALLLLVFKFIFLFNFLFAEGSSECPAGAYAFVNSPDGGTLSILFDQFFIEAGGRTGQITARKSCKMDILLSLPTGYSIGVYKVDYRGFARLDFKQSTDLNVDFNLGTKGNGRNFRRSVHGVHDGDFIFTETLGAGVMKRAGCGNSTNLSLNISLALDAGKSPFQALAALDSVDGAPKGGLVYHLDYKKCR